MNREQHYFNRRMVFDHLPKTAGQAINSWLVGELGSGCVTPNLIGNHDELIRRYGGEYSIISGHIHFDGDWLDPRYRYVTLFREPIDRAVSWLYFVLKNHDQSELRELYTWAAEFIEPEGDVCHDELKSSISNLYANHFGTVVHQSEFTEVQNALATVKLYDVIGFYDDMPQFLSEFATLLRIPAPNSIAKVNVTKERPSVDKITPKLRERLMALNTLDIELYAQLREWYDQRERPQSSDIIQSPWMPYERRTKERKELAPKFKLVEAVLADGHNVMHGQAIRFDVAFALDQHVEELEAGIHIWDCDSKWAFGVNSTLQKNIMRNLTPGMYRVSHYVIANLPEGVYTAGFAFAEKQADGLMRELMWYDKLCEFQVSHPVERVGVGYVELPATQALTQITSFEKNLIEDASGRMTLLSVLDVAALSVGQRIEVCVSVLNQTDIPWIGDHFRPINLSYHWFDASGAVVVADGERTALTEGGVGAQGETVCEMVVVMPEVAGEYSLMLTLVQEGVVWFETMGFEAVLIEQINIQ